METLKTQKGIGRRESPPAWDEKRRDGGLISAPWDMLRRPLPGNLVRRRELPRGKEVDAMAQTVHFDAQSFQAARKSGGVLLADFFATWCMPCRMLEPVIQQLAADYEGRAAVGKVDIDELRELAEEYRVQSVPTVIIFKDGEPVETLVGVRPLDTLKSALDRALQ